MVFRDGGIGTAYDDGDGQPWEGQSPPWDDAEPPPADIPDGNADWQIITGAADLAFLIKPRKSKRADEYTAKTASFLKAGFMGSMNTGHGADAAAILKHGAQFARATGTLADSSERARHYLDIMTAPDSPWLGFAMTALPLISQLMRNHEATISQIPESAKRGWKESRAARKMAKETGIKTPSGPRVNVKIPFIKKEIGLRLRVKFPIKTIFRAFASQTDHPDKLAAEVFSDPTVQKALADMQIYVVRNGGSQ